MNPILLEFLSSVARWAFAFAAGILVKHGVIESGASAKYVEAASSWVVVTGLAAAPLVWAYFKSKMHIKEIKTAVLLPRGTTVEEVKKIAKLSEPK